MRRRDVAVDPLLAFERVNPVEIERQVEGAHVAVGELETRVDAAIRAVTNLRKHREGSLLPRIGRRLRFDRRDHDIA